MEKAAPIVMRVGLVILFLWFGSSQLHDPTMWTSYLPAFLGNFHVSLASLVQVNGLFEVIGAILLGIGCYTRFVAGLLALHLFGIAFTVGLNSVGMRDIGLSFATLSLCLSGAGAWSLDNKSRSL